MLRLWRIMHKEIHKRLHSLCQQICMIFPFIILFQHAIDDDPRASPAECGTPYWHSTHHILKKLPYINLSDNHRPQLTRHTHHEQQRQQNRMARAHRYNGISEYLCCLTSLKNKQTNRTIGPRRHYGMSGISKGCQKCPFIAAYSGGVSSNKWISTQAASR